MNNQKKVIGIIGVNILTFIRFPLTLLFYWCLFSNQYRLLLCIIFFSLIVITDYFDGKLARIYHLETTFGARFDVVADFFFIIIATYGLFLQNLFPIWMLIVIVIKFLEFCSTSLLANRLTVHKSALIFDVLGRNIALTLYLIPITLVLCQYLFPSNVLWQGILIVCGILTCLSVISSCQRIYQLLHK